MSPSSWIDSYKLNQLSRRKEEKNKEGKVLFNDTLNTFCLQLNAAENMVKNHTGNGREYPLASWAITFRLEERWFLYTPSHVQRMCMCDQCSCVWVRDRYIDI